MDGQCTPQDMPLLCSVLDKHAHHRQTSVVFWRIYGQCKMCQMDTLVTSASLLVTSALLVVTRKLLVTSALLVVTRKLLVTSALLVVTMLYNVCY